MGGVTTGILPIIYDTETNQNLLNLHELKFEGIFSIRKKQYHTSSSLIFRGESEETKLSKRPSKHCKRDEFISDEFTGSPNMFLQSRILSCGNVWSIIALYPWKQIIQNEKSGIKKLIISQIQ